MVFTSNITTINSNTTLTTTFDVYIVDASGGNITIQLPTILSDGMQYKLKRTDNTPANTVTIQSISGQLIDSAATFILLPLYICEIQSSTNSWYITANNQQKFGVQTYFNAYKNSTTRINITTILPGTIIPFNTIGSSNAEAGAWGLNGAGTQITIPVSGDYNIKYGINLNNPANGVSNICSSVLTKNGTASISTNIIKGMGSTLQFPANHICYIGASGVVPLVANDVISSYVIALTPILATTSPVILLGTGSLFANDNTQTFISLTKLKQ